MENKSFYASMVWKILKSKKFVIIFSLLAVVFCPVAAVASQMKDTHEPYLTLTMLNSDMKIGNYIANGSAITEQQKVTWYIDAQNGMGKTEYVEVKIKLLNSTQPMPNDVTNTPSPEGELVEFRHVLLPYSHWLTPLTWSISSIEKQDRNVIINKMIINDQVIDNLNIQAADGKDFRIVVELWRYDRDVGDFTFAWSSSGQTRSVWNQIWFNLKD